MFSMLTLLASSFIATLKFDPLAFHTWLLCKPGAAMRRHDGPRDVASYVCMADLLSGFNHRQEGNAWSDNDWRLAFWNPNFVYRTTISCRFDVGEKVGLLHRPNIQSVELSPFEEREPEVGLNAWQIGFEVGENAYALMLEEHSGPDYRNLYDSMFDDGFWDNVPSFYSVKFDNVNNRIYDTVYQETPRHAPNRLKVDEIDRLASCLMAGLSQFIQLKSPLAFSCQAQTRKLLKLYSYLWTVLAVPGYSLRVGRLSAEHTGAYFLILKA